MLLVNCDYWQQGQYKEAMRMFNKEVKELKGKLAEADC